MAKFKAFLVFLLPSILLLLHSPTASAALWGGGAAVGRIVAPRTRQILDAQLTAGGELPFHLRPVPVPVSAPSPFTPLFSSNSGKDGGMSPESPPHSPPPSPPSPPQPSPPQPSPPPPQHPGRCKYVVRTQTGDKWTASTNSIISIRLENREGKSAYMVLTEGNIQTGEQDTFINEEKCVPNVCKMTLYTDGSGWLPCWYVSWVSLAVTNIETGEAIAGGSWEIDEWLPAHEWSGASSLVRGNC